MERGQRRRHSRVRFEPFQGLAAPFPSRSAAQRPLHAPNPPSISRPLRLGRGEAEKHRKRTPSFARRNQRFRDSDRKSLISLWHEMESFRGFVLNHLAACSLRASAKSPAGRRRKSASRPCRVILKNSSRSPIGLSRKSRLSCRRLGLDWALQPPRRGSLFRATQTNAARLFRDWVKGWPLSAIWSQFSGRHATLVLRAARSAAS
jgi:hypothetical protein